MKNTCTCAFWNNENTDYTIHLRSVTFQFLLSSFSLLSLNFWVESGVSRECAESPLTPLALDSNQAPDMIVQTTWSSHPPDLELTLDCQKFYRSGQLIITQGPRLGPLLFSGSDWGLRLLHDCGWWPWGIKFVYSGPSMGLELARPQLVMMWCNTEWPAQASWAKAGRAWPWPSLQARRSQVPESEPDFKVTVSPVWHTEDQGIKITLGDILKCHLTPTFLHYSLLFIQLVAQSRAN